jgi:hypothetical protein
MMKELAIGVMGSKSTSFAGYRSSDDERYVPVGVFTVDGSLNYQAPPRSVTTFYES